MERIVCLASYFPSLFLKYISVEARDVESIDTKIVSLPTSVCSIKLMKSIGSLIVSVR